MKLKKGKKSASSEADFFYDDGNHWYGNTLYVNIMSTFA